MVLAKFNDAAQFSIEMNIDNCLIRYAEYNTEVIALKSGMIKIRELAELYTEESIIDWIGTWLLSVSAQMDFDITEQQVTTTAIFLLEEIYMLNLSEFSLFFKKLRQGKYGIFYGKFNMQTIVLAAMQYRKKRGAEISKMSTDEQQKL